MRQVATRAAEDEVWIGEVTKCTLLPLATHIKKYTKYFLI
jgi:hypothetical protein